MRLIILLIIWFKGCDTGKPTVLKGHGNNMGNDVVSMTNGDTITVGTKDTFEIRLPTNMGTGYSWSISGTGYRKYLLLDTIKVENNPDGKDNSTDLQVFQFKALEKGQITLDFIHSRPWEKARPPDDKKSYLIRIQ
jgi:predicted secreted protein